MTHSSTVRTVIWDPMSIYSFVTSNPKAISRPSSRLLHHFHRVLPALIIYCALLCQIEHKP